MPPHQILLCLLDEPPTVLRRSDLDWDRFAVRTATRLPMVLVTNDGVAAGRRTPELLDEYLVMAAELIEFWVEHGDGVEDQSVVWFNKLLGKAQRETDDPPPGSQRVAPSVLRATILDAVLRQLRDVPTGLDAGDAELLGATVLGLTLARSTSGSTRTPGGFETPFIDHIEHMLGASGVPDDLTKLDEGGWGHGAPVDMRAPGHAFDRARAGRKWLFLRPDLGLFVYLGLALGDDRAPSSSRRLKSRVRLAAMSWALDHAAIDVAAAIADLFRHGRAGKLDRDLVAEVAAGRARLGLTWREASVELTGDASVPRFRADLLLRLLAAGIDPPFPVAKAPGLDGPEGADALDPAQGRGGAER